MWDPIAALLPKMEKQNTNALFCWNKLLERFHDGKRVIDSSKFSLICFHFSFRSSSGYKNLRRQEVVMHIEQNNSWTYHKKRRPEKTFAVHFCFRLAVILTPDFCSRPGCGSSCSFSKQFHFPFLPLRN